MWNTWWNISPFISGFAAQKLGIVTGLVNPPGFGEGNNGVRVRVGILLPIKNPYPGPGYGGYWLTPVVWFPLVTAVSSEFSLENEVFIVFCT